MSSVLVKDALDFCIAARNSGKLFQGWTDIGLLTDLHDRMDEGTIVIIKRQDDSIKGIGTFQLGDKTIHVENLCVTDRGCMEWMLLLVCRKYEIPLDGSWTVSGISEFRNGLKRKVAFKINQQLVKRLSFYGRRSTNTITISG